MTVVPETTEVSGVEDPIGERIEREVSSHLQDSAAFIGSLHPEGVGIEKSRIGEGHCGRFVSIQCVLEGGVDMGLDPSGRSFDVAFQVHSENGLE